ncbi:3-isopropylmalate dehydrogenase [Candidatus Deianiraea vastatrix]|uniref:3-isopropylmalate dehydrogenase n=1 Tax=Candidatus Deianiraea vastatrix TaxID=2163644 RepID=A0A5B8XE56_9RICK|nr:3-isopropylmalate dehydrogenase [Candidatus Deianiraea vastatrix]QED23629.1 3-isopropylmalate dehydrogenase [Candidatus Deianiraea vastatrix]
MKKIKILCLAGDGIGVEVMREVRKILDLIARKCGFEMDIEDSLIGGIAIDKEGLPVSDATIEKGKNVDFVLLGAVGGPKWDGLETHLRPEAGLLKIRKDLNLFANLRPIVVFDELADASPLKKEYISGLNLMIVRELVGGLYFGQPRGIEEKEGQRYGFNTLAYKESEIARIVNVAFDLAEKRGKKVCSVDKANVLASMKLWRDVAENIGKSRGDIELSHMYVDAMAMELVKCPKKYDVLVMENMFGDILSDLGSQLTGSIGMLGSASLGELNGKKTALYEPVHGSAPDIAGRDLANPIAMISSLAMAFKYSINEGEIADKIDEAIKATLKTHRTGDIKGENCTLVGTSAMGDEICKNLEKLL